MNLLLGIIAVATRADRTHALWIFEPSAEKMSQLPVFQNLRIDDIFSSLKGKFVLHLAWKFEKSASGALIFSADGSFVELIKGELSTNFTFWDEPTRDWSAHWRVVSKMLGRLRKVKPSKRRRKVVFVQCHAVQFWYDFYTLCTRVKQKLVCAWRAATCMSVVGMRTRSGMQASPLWRHTTLQSAFREPSRLRI